MWRCCSGSPEQFFEECTLHESCVKVIVVRAVPFLRRLDVLLLRLERSYLYLSETELPLPLAESTQDRTLDFPIRHFVRQAVRSHDPRSALVPPYPSEKGFEFVSGPSILSRDYTSTWQPMAVDASETYATKGHTALRQDLGASVSAS